MKITRYAIQLVIPVSIFSLVILYGCNGKLAPMDFSTPSTLSGTPVSTQMLETPSIPTLTFTPSPTLTETSTPIPTLPPTEAQAAIKDLLENNTGCQFPCWWGFTPGETTWQDVKKTVAPFALKIYEPEPSDNSVQWAEVKFLVPQEVKATPLDHVYRVQNGRVEAIEVNVGNLGWYGLAELLGVYGKPFEVWIRTYNKARENDLPFETVLFYADRRMIMRFYSQGKQKGAIIQGCPQQRPVAMLFFWSAENNWDFLEASSQTQNIRSEDWWPYLPLQEVTPMDVDEFYLVFSDPSNSKCIETSTGFWPSP